MFSIFFYFLILFGTLLGTIFIYFSLLKIKLI
uniref:Cytochrome b6-f complex subunit 6 n=1 Tax=Derbesia sp. WEST4838 TaxID=1847751 RepID=A0A1C9JBH9_9CHLO|nr:cytochrome b6-f complex subunit 6 [Derbesia sp. WEST4838]AOP19210.1 cytochrome b6-f complex subunit 6 [Derbesia sp. WEST4838]